MKKTAYFSNIGSISLPIDIIKMCPVEYYNENIICEMMMLPEVISELEQIDPDDLIIELTEYGIYEPEEIEEHRENLKKILYIACSNMNEENI